MPSSNLIIHGNWLDKIQSVECFHEVCKYIMTDMNRCDRNIEKSPIIPLQSDKAQDKIHSCQRRYKGSLQELLILGAQWHAEGDILCLLLMQWLFYNCHITCDSTIIIVYTDSQLITSDKLFGFKWTDLKDKSWDKKCLFYMLLFFFI